MPVQPLLQQLARLRRREWRVRLLEGLMRWLGWLTPVLLCLMLVDWIWDRTSPTPWPVRIASTAALGLAAVGGWVVLVDLPLRRRLDDDTLSLWVEARYPEFSHALVTAVQLNRPQARTQGMSALMIAEVTTSAARLSAGHDFASLVPGERRRWAWQGLGGLGLLWLVLFAMLPGTLPVLLARQLLFPVAIPRRVTLELLSPTVGIQGEPTELEFRATGVAPGDATPGTVQVDLPDGRAESYALHRRSAASDGAAVYAASIPALLIPEIRIQAWLHDGRMAEPAVLPFVARPVITGVTAEVALPTYAGRQPDGQPLRQSFPKGEVVGLAGQPVVVRAELSKPVADGELELMGQPMPWLSAALAAAVPDLVSPWPGVVREALRDPLTIEAVSVLTRRAQPVFGPLAVFRTVPLRPQGDRGPTAEGTFTLRGGEVLYRLRVRDDRGLENITLPQRTIQIIDDAPPVVEWLPERFSGMAGRTDADAAEVEGMPLPAGGSVRLAYQCKDDFGLREAWLRYRINQGPWQRLPLTALAAPDGAGPFDPAQGSFAELPPEVGVEFHAVPASVPGQPEGVIGGGRFEFHTRALAEARVGSTLELQLEVFDRNPAPEREPGRSSIKTKAIVSEADLVKWIVDALEQERRLKLLEERQRQVFPRITPPGQP